MRHTTCCSSRRRERAYSSARSTTTCVITHDARTLGQMTTHAADAAIPQIVNLGYLLTGHTFTITDFQRDYEWEPTKAVDLFAGYRDDLAKGLPITLLGVISAYHNADGSLAVTAAVYVESRRKAAPAIGAMLAGGAR